MKSASKRDCGPRRCSFRVKATVRTSVDPRIPLYDWSLKERIGEIRTRDLRPPVASLRRTRFGGDLDHGDAEPEGEREPQTMKRVTLAVPHAGRADLDPHDVEERERDDSIQATQRHAARPR